MKAKSGNQGSASKRRRAPITVDEYIASVPESARSALSQMRAAIRSVVPREATETISYKMPAFTHHGVLVWYGAFSDHVSLFPKASIIQAFKNELAGFTTAKGTIQFPLDKPLPVTLIKRLVKARVAEREAKGR